MRELVIVLMLVALPLSGSDPQQQSQDAVPELAGAERVTGPVLVDGKLPAPYIDYIVRIGTNQTQKLSIYQNGLVTMTTRVGERKSMKRVLFPPSAIDGYRKHLSTETLAQIDRQPRIATPTTLRETIRIYDEDGAVEERDYDPSLYLPDKLERARALLQDLARVIVEDNEVTSPLVDYEPKAGDILLDKQMAEWIIVRVVNDHVEVKEQEGPFRVWVKTAQLDEQFTSWTRPDQPAE